MHDTPDQFISRLADSLEPVAPLSIKRGMVIAAAALLATVGAVTAIMGVRADFLSGHPEPFVLTSSGLFLMLALASIWAVVDMARPFVGIRRDGWIWTVLMVAVLPAAAILMTIVNLVRGEPSGASLDGAACLAVGSLASLGTALPLTLWLRRGAPSSPTMAGTMTGVAAGAAGIFAVSIYCPHNELAHIGLWHGLTVLLAASVGRLLITRLIRW